MAHSHRFLTCIWTKLLKWLSFFIISKVLFEFLINFKNESYIISNCTFSHTYALLVDLLLILDSFSLFSTSNMLKFDQFLTFEDWGNKWRSKWGNKMGMWDITTGNLNVWVTKCQGLNFILPK